MTPRTKKLLSSFAVTVAVALLGALSQYVVKLPAELQLAAAAVIAGAAQFVNAWGHTDQVNAQVSAKVAEVVGKEPTGAP
ncbi:MAG TPA: hypothetical protein VER96_33875 [Polyangiaceae bacterium]|nr:hypothetical protein [Polyangiaceae bacterium]